MHRKGFPFMTQHKNIRDFNESPFPTLFNDIPQTATYKKKQEKTFFQEFHIKRQSMRMLPSTLHYFCSNRVFYSTEAPPLSQYNLQLSYTTISLILLIQLLFYVLIIYLRKYMMTVFITSVETTFIFMFCSLQFTIYFNHSFLMEMYIFVFCEGLNWSDTN